MQCQPDVGLARFAGAGQCGGTDPGHTLAKPWSVLAVLSDSPDATQDSASIESGANSQFIGIS